MRISFWSLAACESTPSKLSRGRRGLRGDRRRWLRAPPQARILPPPKDTAISHLARCQMTRRARVRKVASHKNNKLRGSEPDELFTTHATQGVRCVGGFGRHRRAVGGAGPDGGIYLQIRQQPSGHASLER